MRLHEAYVRHICVNAICIFIVPQELQRNVKFLQEVWRQHRSRPLSRFAELGCGPARHAVMLQKASKAAGVGIDNSGDMLRYAGQLAAAAGVQLQLLDRDMQLFQLQEPVDLAFMLLGTFSHLLDHASALACLASVLGALKPDGLLLLELAHPEDILDGSLVRVPDAWDFQGPNEEQLIMHYGLEEDDFDALQQVVARTVTVTDSKQAELVHGQHRQRLYTLPELQLLSRIAGFEVAAMYGAMDLNCPVDSEEAYRLVLVLQPQAAEAPSPD